MAWTVFMGSGPGPEGRPGMTTQVFQHPASPIYAWGKYILVALIDVLTFWLQSGVAGIGDRCRCGGLVGSGLGRRWRLKGSGRVQGQNAPALR